MTNYRCLGRWRHDCELYSLYARNRGALKCSISKLFCSGMAVWAVHWQWEETDVEVEHNIFVYKIFLFYYIIWLFCGTEAKIKVIFTHLPVLLITDLKNQEKILLIVTLLKGHQEDQKILLQWKQKVWNWDIKKLQSVSSILVSKYGLDLLFLWSFFVIEFCNSSYVYYCILL